MKCNKVCICGHRYCEHGDNLECLVCGCCDYIDSEDSE